jgi:DNA-directed RNA polymerase subunit F
MMKFVIRLVLGSVLLAVPVMAQNTASSSADTNAEILIQKIKADKKLLVAGNMDLSDAEAKQFWPLYEDYQKELEQTNQRIGKTIMEYAEAFNKGPIPNETAKKLLDEVLVIEEAEAKTKRAYADKVAKVLPAAKTARSIQIETKMRALLRAELAKRVPLAY